MMRGPTYDDAYISRKMSSMHGPTFAPPGGAASYGRPPMGGYMQDPYCYDYGPRDTYIPYSTPYSSSSLSSTTYTPTSTSADFRDDRRSVSPIRSTPTGYRPSASTQLILNRVALRNSGHRNSLPPMGRGYPPMGPPPPRMVPRMAPAYPSYYDYDYGYGGGYGYPSAYGYGYAPPPPPPRMSRYDTYLEDEMPEPTYQSRYRSRVPDTLEEIDIRDKLNSTSTTKSTTTPRITSSYIRSKSPPGMLQDHVDKMRIRLKSIAFSLDPSGPVPDIIIPERPRKGGDADKKYTQAEFTELPKLASRRQRYYPEDDYIKDNLRIKCLSHYKTTRTAADYWKPKQYNPDDYKVPSDTSSRYDKLAGAKWEEPDTVFGTPSDKKPYSKSLTDGTSEESDDKKERRRKKKSKERELSETLAIESSVPVTSTTPAPPSDLSTSEADREVDKEASLGDEEGLDDKERKKLEKKKRKAEREAAAKAAMEAELAALAAAEAELARLEAESSSLKTDSPAPPAESPAPAAEPSSNPAETATEVKSESAADKCESSTEVVVCEGVSVTPESLGELPPLESPLQVPPQEEIVEQMPVEVEEASKGLEEPPVESQIEVSQEEYHSEEPPAEPLAEDVQVEPVAEVTQIEEPQAEPQMEEPQPELLMESQVEGVQAEPHVESSVELNVEPYWDEPQPEPQMEECAPAIVDDAAVVEESAVEAVLETPPAAGGDVAETSPTDGGTEDIGTEADAAVEEEDLHAAAETTADAVLDTTTIADVDTTFGRGLDEGLQDTITLPSAASESGEAFFDDSADTAADAATAAATSAIPSSANRSEEDPLE